MFLPLCCAALAASLTPAPTPLERYARTPDPAFAWSKTDVVDTPGVAVYGFRLTSQVWQGITWTHGAQLFLPKNRPATTTAVLWNQGGNPEPGATLLGTLLADRIGAPVVFLYGVPNQPLFGGKREDALIAETFVRYLDTGDPTLPLLFPMVKAVLAAMTAAQEFGKEKGLDLQKFVVTGASKRGWTSWLAAASGDRRVQAIAPMVIDTLNMPAQMPHQLKSFGKPSEMIQDYTRRGLVPIPKTGRAEELWKMVDPYQYRERLSLPKLILNGANDPYWATDALTLYWDGLPGPKSVLTVPNAGHNLQEKTDDAGHTSRDRVVNALVAFCKAQVDGVPVNEEWPAPKWSTEPASFGLHIDVRPGKGSRHVEFWRATAPTRDFRKAKWERVDAGAPDGNDVKSLNLDRPAGGFAAAFGLVTYRVGGVEFQIGTPVFITEPAQ